MDAADEHGTDVGAGDADEGLSSPAEQEAAEDTGNPAGAEESPAAEPEEEPARQPAAAAGENAFPAADAETPEAGAVSLGAPFPPLAGDPDHPRTAGELTAAYVPQTLGKASPAWGRRMCTS